MALESGGLTPWVGVIGVAVGFGLSLFKDIGRAAWSFWRGRSREAILLRAHLDRLVNECVSAAFDDGYVWRPPDREPELTTNFPKFDPFSLDVSWGLLSAGLVSEIFALQHELARLEETIAAYSWDLADYEELSIPIRQYGCARIGMRANAAKMKLEKEARLPAVNSMFYSDDGCSGLREQVDKLGAKIKGRAPGSFKL
ncbi:hypothetical protein [Chromobacterium sp. ASV23]|uniref:hypothetical protein n=1 Tax=Chromobacterium sp. ASV23 TaxID=2795110 RepID=UPI0018EA89FD|nr:hypothetical protein [Chromobacterium sp. ASV23]